jgi:hypothetical protein
VYSLSKDVDPAVVAGVLAKYPSLSGDSRGELRKEVELGLRAVKQEMLREIAGFEEALSSAEEVAFVEWFKGTRERVKNQL